MQKRMQHHGGRASQPNEILFDTQFDYLFPVAARDAGCRDRDEQATRDALLQLAAAMTDPGDVSAPREDLDSPMAAVMTYLGQFIDHDITARTDRDEELAIGPNESPVSPDEVVHRLRNGRRPTLDLDSVYGDGPGLAPGSRTVAQTFLVRGLYRPNNLRMRLVRDGRTVDLPRLRRGDANTGRALIADERNDENVIISQLHAAFLALHNRVEARLPATFDTPAKRFVRARQLVRWAYQYIVANEYLPTVCDAAVVADVKANGPRFLGPTAGRTMFMPLEFSVAGFRFGHSMVRPFYDLNAESRRTIDQIFFPSRPTGPGENTFEMLVPQPGDPARLVLDPKLRVDWDFFVPGGDMVQPARRIDPLLAMGLQNLTFVDDPNPRLRSLAERNLLRAHLLSMPTGQAVAKCMGIVPITTEELASSPSAAINAALGEGGLGERTPLWFYVLREAEVQQQGHCLGEIGSRIVAETLWGLLVGDPTSVVHNAADPAVTPTGVALPTGDVVDTISAFTQAARVTE